MESLKKYLIQGATSYLEFLEQTNKGLEEIHILRLRIERYNTLFLEIDRMLFSTEYLQVYIKDYAIDIDTFEEKSFNEQTKVLKLQFSNSLLTTLMDEITNNDKESQQDKKIKLSKNSVLSYLLGDNYKKEVPKHLRLFNDLKFLVKNIKKFCQQDLLELALPQTKPIPLQINLDSHINKEQQEAIKGIFTHSISYIWGISGSGKTQVVLFNCLLNLITQNKKTLVLAPTNTVLEQIFIALITQGDKKGLLRQKFLRLGMPSNDFLQNFPDVCLHNDEKDSKEDELNLFKPQTLQERLQESLVIGVTLDSFVKRYFQLCELEFAHIFLDECAFSPLIKLIAPLTLNTPITLLGDHKQLMPICLMQDSMIQNKHFEVCVWSLNTLFLEMLFNNHEILHLQRNYDDITFNAIAHYKLTTTHRYGNNIAQVLDKHVYHNGLKGVGLPTEIYYIDSTNFGLNYQYNPQDNRNENIGEANAIAILIQTLMDEYAILTPFKDQQKLLISKHIPKHSVFTIHKSQGKEFDTIIFSPVKFSKYMTDSYNKAALFALNVAVSRLKKKLIVVCDYYFWIHKRGQFITAILQNAKPYPITHISKL